MTASELLRRQRALQSRQARGLSQRQRSAIRHYCSDQPCFVCGSRGVCVHREPEILALPADVLEGEAALDRRASRAASRRRVA